ncbi:MAPEG family protein [Enterovirga sp. GCM10030262]|uniref:MAPEG family protein n=1 Tax=Enterovirga sp. GCM10030262 TaxID=3273391 RepID=UPI00360DD3EF
MQPSPILGPIVALVAWSLVMMLWMAATRLPAMSRKGIRIGTLVGGRGADLDGVLEDSIQWKSHNYAHLMEQPTVFYAVALSLALMDQGDGLNLTLAWVYVGLRIAHSLVQAIFNRVLVRFLLFLLSSLALVGLTVHAAAVLLNS